MYTDIDEGWLRYLLVTDKIEDIDITILNAYLLPSSTMTIYRKIFDLMSQATGILICGCDWNIQVLTPRLDSPRMSTITPTHKKIKIMCELGVIDLWQDFHSTERDCTHYSNPHVYSTIDYIFIFKRDRYRVH